MLSVSLLKGTRVYQEIKEETQEEIALYTKLGLVPKLLQKAMSIQEIAELLELDEETVRKAVK
jgi:predicted transposase YdaD